MQEEGVVKEERMSEEQKGSSATDGSTSEASLSRGKFLAGAAVTGLAVAAVPGVAQAKGLRRNAALANGLAPGKVGFAGSIAIGHEICGHVLLPVCFFWAILSVE